MQLICCRHQAELSSVFITVSDTTLMFEAEMPAFVRVLFTDCMMADDAFGLPAETPGRFSFATKVDICTGACKENSYTLSLAPCIRTL